MENSIISENVDRQEEVKDTSEQKVVHNSDSECRKKHRRGKKKNRPKWKPYAKMTQEERRRLEQWETARIAKKDAELALKSRRPVAPFNTTQFLMEDRTESQTYKSTSDLARCVSIDSSPSGGVTYHANVAGPLLSLTPPSSDIDIPLSSPPYFSLLRLGDDAYENEDEDLQEQEAFLEADFNQVYMQLRMDRLEAMNKQDLVQECYSLEERIMSLEEERSQMMKELQHLQTKNQELGEENSRLPNITLTQKQ